MKYKQYLTIVTLGCVTLVSGTTTAYAQVMDTTERIQVRNQVREEVRENMQDSELQVQERVQERQELREEVRQNLEEKKQERIGAFTLRHAERLEKRFADYARRLTNIADRLEQRINTTTPEFKQKEEALEKIAEARQLLSQAETGALDSISEFRSIDVIEYESYRSIALSARDTAEETRELFLEARKTLQEALRLVATNAPTQEE